MTDTLELAKKCGAHVFDNPLETETESWSKGDSIFSAKMLQAFREAVEAESDAERMKQPVACYAVPDFKEVMWKNGMTIVDRSKGDLHTLPLYAQPFPSTEQLQQRVKELTDALRNSDHSPNCCTRDRDAFDEREPCNCGRDKAFANTQGEKK